MTAPQAIGTTPRTATLDPEVAQGPQNGAPGESFLYPRWLLLAAIWFSPLIVASFLVDELFFFRGCPFGVLCAPGVAPDTWPGVMQALLLWIVYAVLLLVARAYGRSHGLDGSEIVRRSAFARAMNEWSAVARARMLAWGIAAVVGAAFALALRLGSVDGPTVGIGLLTLFVSIRCATAAPARPPRRLIRGDTPEQIRHERTLRQDMTFWGQLRNSPPLSWFFRRGY